MTQDEVNLIYDYLHTNYKYVDGELISIKNNKPLGSIITGHSKNIEIIASLSVYKEKKKYKLTTLIYIYFNKLYEKYIAHLNNNPTDTRIENLIKTTAKICQASREWTTGAYRSKGGGYFCAIKNNFGHMGVYETEEIAKMVFSEARDLYFNQHLDIKEVRRKIKDKYYQLETDTKRIDSMKGCFKYHNKFQVTTRLSNKAVYVGAYDTQEEARESFLRIKKLRDFDEIPHEEILLMIANEKTKRNKSTGYTGVTKKNGRYLARLRKDEKVIYAEIFDTPEEAHAAYLKAKEEQKKEALASKD